MKYILFILLGLSLNFSAFASAQMKKLFADSFNTKYVAADCLMNIARLLEDAEKLKININNANVLYMTNEGTSVFGHIKGEYARGRTAVSPRNWYFHVVLEMDGLIYDFDYGQTPQVVPVRAYFDKMFLSEKAPARYDFNYVGRERKLEDYQVRIMDGVSVTRAKNRHDMPKGEKVRFGEYLKLF